VVKPVSPSKISPYRGLLVAVQELRVVAPLATVHSLYYLAGLLGWQHGYRFTLTSRGPFSKELAQDLARGHAPKPPRHVIKQLQLLVARLCGNRPYCGKYIVVAALLAAYARLYPPPKDPIAYYLQRHPGVDPSLVRRVASILTSLGMLTLQRKSHNPQ